MPRLHDAAWGGIAGGAHPAGMELACDVVSGTKRRIDMERSNIALIAAASFALASGVMAQQPAPRVPPQAGQSQEIQLSDADLEKFADIYVDLLDTEAKFEEELAGAQTEDQAREVQTRMQEESVAKLARHGGILSDFIDRWYDRQVLSVQHGVEISKDAKCFFLALGRSGVRRAL